MPMSLSRLSCAALFIFMVFPAWAQNVEPASDAQKRPETPAPIEGVILAKPFELAEGYTFSFSQAAPTVRSGVILVLKVDPALAEPRDTLQPVLYAGDSPVQIISDGHPSGVLVGIAPEPVEIGETLFWFGRPSLPERVTPEIVTRERALARRAGIEPPSKEAMQRARAEPVKAENLATLLRDEVAEIIREYAPEDHQVADTLQLPIAGVKPGPNPE